MQFSTNRSERITAIVSTLAAVAILAGGVTAYQSHNRPIDDVVHLESDLRYQLEVAFGHNPNERVERLDRLEQVSQAWQRSPREDLDREKLASWLLEATILSMPGSIEPLPKMPNFGEQQAPVDVPKIDGLVAPPVAVVRELPSENRLADQDLVRAAPSIAAKFPDQAEPLPTPTAMVFDVEPESSYVTGPVIFVPEIDPIFVAPTKEVVELPPVAAVKPPVTKPVRINLTELAARIAGYHNGLKEVEASLTTLAADDFTALNQQIQQLDEMTRDYQFVSLYYQTLTNREQQTMTAPRSLTATLHEVERRIDRNQAAQSGDFLEEFDTSNQEQLAMLRRRLSEVASRVDR